MRVFSLSKVFVTSFIIFQVVWLVFVWKTGPTDKASVCTGDTTGTKSDKKSTKDGGEATPLGQEGNIGQLVTEHEPLIKKKECFLFVMILSSSNGRSRRDAVRQTWMLDYHLLTPKVIIKFIIGTNSLATEQQSQLTTEEEEFNDIILLPELQESFKNLSRKVRTSFVHIDQSYSFKYLFKGDDDTYIQLDLLLSELAERNSQKSFYWGFFDGRSRPKKAGKYEEADWFVCDLYLPYALGGGYVISGDLVSRITVNAEALALYNSEDVSVGLWLSAFDMERRHDVRFNTEYMSRGCQNVYLVSHKQTEWDMKEKYTNIKKLGKQCVEEKQIRGSYHYNWDVPPSQCCKREMGIP